jgi:hypothetical protein
VVSSVDISALGHGSMSASECANLETDLDLGIFSNTKPQCSTRPLPLTAALRTLLTLPRCLQHEDASGA